MNQSLGALGCVLAVFGVAPARPDATNPSMHADMPPCTLSRANYPEGVADEDGLALWRKQRSAAMTDAASRVHDPVESARLRLDAANWILAEQCEPQATRWLLGESDPADAEVLGRLVAEGRTLLDDVRKTVDSMKEKEGDDREGLETLHGEVELLNDFANALDATRAADAESPKQTQREAARRLSMYLEDTRPQVAAAAELWQAALYASSGRASLVKRLIPLATQPPRPGAMEYDFFNRLLRCRVLADEGSHAVAWSLLLSLEEQAQTWFTDDNRRAESGRTAAMLRMTRCEKWFPGKPGDDNDESWCDARRTEIIETHFADEGGARLLRLVTAAPLVVEIPTDEELQSKVSASSTGESPHENSTNDEPGNPTEDEPENSPTPTP